MMMLVWILLLAGVRSQYQRITDYDEYISKWLSMVKDKHVYNMSHLSNKKQLCFDKKSCQFYYFQSVNETLASHSNTNRTVLMVSGMHGNQWLGPSLLLEGYKYFQAARILYVPIANPSGYANKRRKTYPGEIDPNRDFPIDGNTNCYNAISTHLIDYIFRNYEVDLTLSLHNGATQIGFNWGTFTHQQNSHTVQYDIYSSLAKMMYYYGGSNPSLDVSKFKIGTMTESVYPVNGSFEDWAYSASWSNKSFTPQCKKYSYQPYPNKMTKGLVFLIELGNFKPHAKSLGTEKGIFVSPQNKSPSNGHISRGIRMIKQLLTTLNPYLKVMVCQQQTWIKLYGCKSAQIQILQVKNEQNKTILKLQNTKIEGNINQKFVQVLKLKTTLQTLNYYYSYKINCDNQWKGMGKSMYSQPRIYSYKSNKNEKIADLQSAMQTLNQTNQFSNKDFLIIIIILIVLFFCLFGCWKIYSKYLKQLSRRIANEQMQQHEISYQIQEQLTSRRL